MALDASWTRIERTAAGGVEDPASDTLPGLTPTWSAAVDRAPETPRQIGRFGVLGVLGEGGMGTVYDAFDTELGRRVAIKLVRTIHESDSSYQARLAREAQAMARLSHPNVVQIYEVGQFAGTFFLALEFIAGQDLRGWLAPVRRTWREIVEVFMQAGRGLAAAHSAGIVHRDFKPDNVLVGENGAVKVADFGLAHAQSPNRIDTMPMPTGTDVPAPLLTQAGQLVGTPAYMSPEQYLGKPLDARSDQFSFCVTLFEALYGRRPFIGHTLAELCLAVVGPRAPLPVDREVPAWLRRVIERGLQVDPDRRFPDMHSLLGELSVDRRRTVRAGILGLAVLSSITAGVMLGQSGDVQVCRTGAIRVAEVWNTGRADEVRDSLLATGVPYAAVTWPKVRAGLDAYARAWAVRRDEACEATHVRGVASEELFELRNQCLDDHLRDLGALVNVLVTADAATVERSLQATSSLPPLSACADDDHLRVRLKPPADRELAAEVDRARHLLARAAARRDAGRPREARELAASVQLSSTDLDYPPLRVEALLELGRCEESTGNFELAHRHLDDAYQAAIAINHDAVATDAAISLSLLLHRMGDHREALRWSDFSRSLLQRTGDQIEQRIPYLLFRSYILTRMDSHDEATAAAREGLLLAEERLPAEDPRIARMMAGVAHTEWARGNTSEALALFERSQAFARVNLGHNHPLVAGSAINICSILMMQGRWTEAEVALRPALAIMEQAFGPDHSNVADVLTNLGAIAATQGRLRQAIAAYERAHRIYARQGGPGSPLAIAVLADLGSAQNRLGDHGIALDTLRRAVALEQSGGDLKGAASHHLLIAETLIDMRRYDEAEAELKTTLALLDRDPDSRLHCEALGMSARIARERGNPRLAEVLARSVLEAINIETANRDITIRSAIETRPELSFALLQLGQSLLALGRVDEALVACRDALAGEEMVFGAGTVNGVPALSCIGRAHHVRDELAEAREVLMRAVEIVDRAEVAPQRRASTLAALALVIRSEDPAGAATLVKRALADYAAAGPVYAADATELTRSFRTGPASELRLGVTEPD